jgi:hypothetical protein
MRPHKDFDRFAWENTDSWKRFIKMCNIYIFSQPAYLIINEEKFLEELKITRDEFRDRLAHKNFHIEEAERDYLEVLQRSCPCTDCSFEELGTKWKIVRHALYTCCELVDTFMSTVFRYSPVI